MLSPTNDSNASELRKRSMAQSSSTETVQVAPAPAPDTKSNDNPDVVWGKTPTGPRTNVF